MGRTQLEKNRGKYGRLGFGRFDYFRPILGGAIDSAADGVSIHLLGRAGLKQFLSGIGGGIEPLGEILAANNDGHAVVDRFDEFVGGGREESKSPEGG